MCICVGDHYEAVCGGGIVCACVCVFDCVGGWLVADAS